MDMTKHFGLLFISDEKKPGRGVFRIYAKNWTHHDYPGVQENHAYLMPQVSNFKELDRQLDELVTDLAVLRVVIRDEHEQII
jgi:hypothetical protein